MWTPIPVYCPACEYLLDYIGYKLDNCNCSNYYVCKLGDKGWTAQRLPCPSCQHFDPELLTCVKVTDDCDGDSGQWVPGEVTYDGGKSDVNITCRIFGRVTCTCRFFGRVSGKSYHQNLSIFKIF